MEIKLKSSGVCGKLNAPSSKSHTHRAILASILSEQKTTVINPLTCDDTLISLKIAKALNVQVEKQKNNLCFSREQFQTNQTKINCQGSGTSLRFFTPVCSLGTKPMTLTGNTSLLKRPMGDLIIALNTIGISCKSIENNGLPPIFIQPGKIKGGSIEISGMISSQFISALLFIAPFAENPTRINVIGNLESKPYVQMTLDVLHEFGIRVVQSENLNHLIISGNQSFKSHAIQVEGDYSSAAFLLAAGALTGKVIVDNLLKQSSQGDKQIIELLSEMNAQIKVNKNKVQVEKSDLKGININVENIPDLVPILAVLGTQAQGKTIIENAARLRFKESDRLNAICTELQKMGAQIEEKQDSLVIYGKTKLKGAKINSHEDHRIAMACAIAGLTANGTTKIQNAECVSKSYPLFFSDLEKIGGEMECKN
ncbi:MAG: 3-phosphoshikimate 1-carboxyvinyltransferase [Candidatus Diapherotrites archaeon]|nr:3-phosphoshikimate 1-carboxyvinyltransferase [Candidatus Diapherotrites archaeon]